MSAVKGFLFLVLLTFFSKSSFAAVIKGKLQTGSSWSHTIYLKELQRYNDVFSGSNKGIIDSCSIGADGSFIFKSVKPNIIYRLNTVPAFSNTPGMIIQNGKSDNYAFITVSAIEDTISVSGSVERLFMSHNVICNSLDCGKFNSQIAVVRENKKPVYDTMAYFYDLFSQADIQDKDSLRLKAVTTIQQVNASTNKTLVNYIKTVEDGQIMALGLVFANFEQLDDEAFSTEELLNWKSDYSLGQSVLNRLAQLNMGRTDTAILEKNLSTISGKEINLKSIESDYLLLDFWASWCIPCRQAINGSLKRLAEKYPKEKLTIIGINEDENINQALAAIKADKNDMLQIHDADEYLKKRFAISSFPHYLLINRLSGKVSIVYPETVVLP